MLDLFFSGQKKTNIELVESKKRMKKNSIRFLLLFVVFVCIRCVFLFFDLLFLLWCVCVRVFADERARNAVIRSISASSVYIATAAYFLFRESVSFFSVEFTY